MSKSVKTLAIASAVAAAVAGTTTITHRALRKNVSVYHWRAKTIVPRVLAQHAQVHPQ